jgi:peptidyl-prolyl cis-trans isomerase-like protein 2
MSFRELRCSEIRDKIYDEVRKNKMKGYVQMVTNVGAMNFIIHCNLVPKTSENFL